MKSSKRIFVALATILVLEASAHDSYQNFQQGSPANNFNNQNKNVPLNTFQKFGQGNNQQNGYNHNQAPPQLIQTGHNFNQRPSNINTHNVFNQGPGNIAFNRNQEYQQNPNFGQSLNNGQKRQPFQSVPPFQFQNPQRMPPQFQNFPAFRPVNNQNTFSGASSSASSNAAASSAVFQNRPGILNNANRFNMINLPVQTGLPTAQTIKLPIPSNSKYKIVHLGPTQVPDVKDAVSKQLFETNTSYQQNVQPIKNENKAKSTNSAASKSENVKEKQQFINNLDPNKIENAIEDIKEAELELSNILENDKDKSQVQSVLNTARGQYGTSLSPKDGNSYPTSGFLNNQPYYLTFNSNTQDSAPKSEIMQGKEHTNKVEKAMKDIKEAEIELRKILEYERNILNKEQPLAQTVSNKAGSQYRVPSTPSQENDNSPTSSFIGLNKPYMPITSYSNSQASGSSLAIDSLQNSLNMQKKNLNYPYNNQYGNPSALQYIPNNLSGTKDILNSGPASNTYPGLNSPASSGSLSFDNENSQSQSFTSSSSSALNFSNKNIGPQYLPNTDNLPPLNGINQPLYSPLNGPNYGSLYKNIPASSLPPITDFSLNKYEAPKLTSSNENGPTPTSYNSPNNNIFNKPIQPLLTDANQQTAADQDKTNSFGDFTNSNNIMSGTSLASATSQTDTTNSKYSSANYPNTFDLTKYMPTNYQNYLNSHNIVPETTDYNNNHNFVDNPTLIYKENDGLNNPIKNAQSTNINDFNNTPVFGNSNNGTNEQPYIFLNNEPSKVTGTSSTSSSSSSSSLDASTSSSTYAFNSNPYTTNYAYLPNQPTWPNYGQISSLVQPTYTPLDNKYLLPNNELPVAGDTVTNVNTVPNYEFNNPINIPPSEGNDDSLAKITYGDVAKLTSIDTSQAESSISQDSITVNQSNILTDNSPSIIGHKTPQSDFDSFKYDKNENSAILNFEAVDVTTISPYGYTEPQTDVITSEGSSDTETEYNGYSNVSSSSSSSKSVATSDSETTDAKRTNYQLISSHPRANHKGKFQRRNPFRWQHKKNRFGHGFHTGTEDSLTFGQRNKWDQLIYDTTSPLPIFDDDVSKNPKDENKGTDNPLPTTTDNDNLLSTDTPASADYSESDISQSDITKNKNKNYNDSQNQHLKYNTDKKYDGSPSESSYTGSDESSASENSQYDSLYSQLNEYTNSKRNKYLYGGRYNRRPEFAFHSTDSPAGSYGIPDDIFNIKNNGDESHQSSEADQDSLFHTSTSPYTNDESQTSLPVTETNDSTDSYNYYKNSDYSAKFESSHVESESETVSEIETVNIDIQNGSKMRKQRKQYPGYRHRQLNRWKNNPENSYAPTTDTPVKGTTDNQYSFDHTTVIPFGHPNYEWTVPFNNVPLHNLHNTQSPYVNTDQYNTGRPLLIPYGNTMFDWNNANTETPTYNYPSQTQSPVQNSHGQDNKDQTTEIPYFNPNYDWNKVNTDAPSNNYPIQSTSDDLYPSTYSPNTEKDRSDINKTSYTSYNHQYAHTSDTTSVLKDITNTNTITKDKYTSTSETESDKKEESKKTETNHVQHAKGSNEKVNEESSSTDVKEKTEYSSKTKNHKNQVKKSSETRNTSEFSFDPQTENPYIRGLTIVLKILDSIEKLITGKCENGKA